MQASTVVTFVDDYEKGKLKPFLKSEPEPTPEELRWEVVTVLVGTTFSKVARDPEYDVLVDFFAPWCSSPLHPISSVFFEGGVGNVRNTVSTLCVW